MFCTIFRRRKKNTTKIYPVLSRNHLAIQISFGLDIKQNNFWKVIAISDNAMILSVLWWPPDKEISSNSILQLKPMKKC